MSNEKRWIDTHQILDIDIYKILDEDWFEQIGEFSDNGEEYAPIDYEEVAYAIYSANSFFGPEFVDLFVDEFTKTYYIRIAIRQPIGDYGFHTVWAWYKSVDGIYDKIREEIKKELEKEDKNEMSM